MTYSILDIKGLEKLTWRLHNFLARVMLLLLGFEMFYHNISMHVVQWIAFDSWKFPVEYHNMIVHGLRIR